MKQETIQDFSALDGNKEFCVNACGTIASFANRSAQELPSSIGMASGSDGVQRRSEEAGRS